MENASKALLIVAGILFAILIIGLLMYTWNALGNYTSQIEEEEKKEQLTAFNKQYEVYQRQLLRGSDVASLINKVRDNNKIHSQEIEYQITWQFILKRGILGVLGAGTYDEARSSVYNSITNNQDDFRDFKNLYFRCKSIEYNSKNGRVNKIVFEEILYEDIFKN